MKRKFNIIKKSRKKSKDIDEKIEYLNKECQKTGLNEIMSTTGMYFSAGEEENSAYTTFNNASFNGKALGLTSFSGLSIRGSTNASGHSISPDGLRVAKSWQGIANGFQARPPGYQRTPTHRKVGAFLWYWNGTYYDRLEWKYDNQNQGNAGEWAQWKSGMFPYLDPIIGDDSVDPDLLAAILAAGGGGAAFPDPDGITPPTNPVLFKNDLDDPSYIPIDIGEMSPQTYNWLKERAKEFAKKYNRKYQGANDPFWDDFVNSFPDIPAGDEDPFTRKGTGMDDRWIGPPVDKVDAGPVSDTEIPGLGAQPGDQLAFGGFGGGKPTPPTKKSDFKGMKRNAATTAATMSVNGMGMSPAAFEKKYGISPKDFLNLPENKTSHKKYLEEGVKLGYFEPEVLNVNINDIRKGIMPEFPKDPPPEMIDGYSAKSRLAPKKVELPPFIKVTRKDLAKNHLLTDKEISQYMDEINMINDYIKKNPAELIYAMTRYPKDDPRLAQLNWQMDQKMKASEEYMDTHFPENQKLFNKLQDKIIKNIEQTDPNNFTGHKEAPKFTDDNIEMSEQRKQIALKHFKKPVKKNKRNRIQRHVNMKEVKKKNMEEVNARNLEEKRIEDKNQILKSAYEKQKSDWKEDLKEFTGWQAVAGASPTNATSQTFGYVDGGFPVPNSETGQQVTTTASGLGGVEVQPSVVNLDLGFGETMPVNPPTYDQLALAGYAKPILMKRRDTEDVNPRLDASQEFAQNVGADVMMNARVRGSGVSKEKADEIIKLAKFSKELETFFKYLFNKGPKVIDNNYFSKEQVTNLFKNGYINDKGNFAVNDYIIGSGQKLTYNPQNNTYSVKFNYNFDDNITEIINNPEKYNYKPGFNRLVMNLRLIFGGKYGLDALGLPGRAIEIAKLFGGGQAIPGEISIDANELHNNQWGQDLLKTHFEMNPEGDGFDTGHGHSAPPPWLDRWARKTEFTGDLRSLWNNKTRTWNLGGKIVDNDGIPIKKATTPKPSSKQPDRTGYGVDEFGNRLDSSGYGMDPARYWETEARPIKQSKAVKKIKSMAKTKRQSLSLDEPFVRAKGKKKEKS